MSEIIKGVSVIVCCYNSADRISQTLKHLISQKVPETISWEILIIDNACTDNTIDLIKIEFVWQGLTPNLRILSEPKAGLSFARKKGIESANYEYLLFCDDDNWLSENYISEVYKTMNSDLQIAVLGGKGIFEPEHPVNHNILKYKREYVNGQQTWVENEHWVYGAGATYRKSILLNLFHKGWKQVTTDRNKKDLTSGGDVEICFICFLSGYKITANDRLIFEHFVPLARQDAKYLLKLSHGVSYSHVLLNGYYMIMSDSQESIKQNMHQWYVQATKNLIKLIIIQLLKKIKNLGNLDLSEQIKFQQTYGTFRSLFKHKNKVINHHAQLTFLLKNLK